MANKVGTVSGKDVMDVRAKNGVLFLAGIVGAIVYVLNVVLGGIITPDHSHIRNAVSELTQRGAPNIALLSAFFVLSAVLIFVYGVAITRRYRQANKRVYAGGILIMIYAVFAALLASIFPQDPIGTEATFPGTMHLALAGLSAFVILGSILLIGLAKHEPADHWRHFGLYSVISAVFLLVFGVSTPILMMNEIELLGLFERLTQVAYLQWFVVFAFKSYTQTRSVA